MQPSPLPRKCQPGPYCEIWTVTNLWTHSIIGEVTPISPARLSPHWANITPGHFTEAEEEPFPDHRWQLVLGDGDKAECFVETDQLKGRVHVQHVMPAGVDFVPARRAWRGRDHGILRA